MDPYKAGRSKRTIPKTVKREQCTEAWKFVITVPMLDLLTPMEKRSHFRDPMGCRCFKKKKKKGINWVNSYVIKVQMVHSVS